MKKNTTSSCSQTLPDEGYCEDPLYVRTLFTAPLPQWLLQMSVTERTSYVMNIISQLPTSQVVEIVNRLRPRLYINFFEHLPDEVLLHILSFLDPISLFNTACTSKQWMSVALDSKLWEQLYFQEGFGVINSEIHQFEQSLNQISSELSMLKDRFPVEFIKSPVSFNNLACVEGNINVMNDKGVRSKLESFLDLNQQVMHSQAVTELFKSTSTFSGLSISPGSRDSLNDLLYRSQSQETIQKPEIATIMNMSLLFRPDYCGDKIKYKLNWQYLYSQRRRLEANWEAEKYINFQLPDPNYPEEAHKECIYTIQHSGKYLVSGSRDMTVRIWNLETRRLVRPPLRAHSGSVLCLQFDADPSEDLIVSGSSDSTIVLWKFSTGKKIQRLRSAHSESVLNVQFDKRILVTCSKDRTIKIFNRKPIYLEGCENPVDIEAVNPVPILLNSYGLNPVPTKGILIKPAYSLISTLEGHVAAVNAVQIQGHEIVSASGDRLVKVWNWPEQTCVRTLVGHSKGIACVQCDGRRIVSGSSDNEVKVFDKETGLEVASLRAHTNLVRTVQAGFGDLPYSAEKDMADARAVDYEYFKALDSGTLSGTAYSEREQLRNTRSRRPENITAYGAKLPPGGGGGKFGRIVSGSYDETIIIWRRDKEGVWKAQHKLKQEEAAQAARRNIQTPSEPPREFLREVFYRYLIEDAVIRGPNVLRSTLSAHPETLEYHNYLRDRISHLSQETRQSMEMVIAAAMLSRQTMIQSHPFTHRHPDLQRMSANNAQSNHRTDTLTIDSENSLTIPLTETSISTINQVTDSTSASNQSQTAPNFTPETHNLSNPPINNEITRVFKLQFDARRIICCSQTNIIVGWDFANNDQKIVEASRFFAPIE